MNTKLTRMVGYVVAHRDLEDEMRSGAYGEFYSYVLAGNGVFVQTANEYLVAAIPIALAPVRGLKEKAAEFRMLAPRIPVHLLDMAVSIMSVDPSRERYVAIVWRDRDWRLVMPEQETGQALVTYHRVPDAVVELHSHGQGSAFFSATDNADEQRFGIFGVVGNLHCPSPPTLSLRLGIYGYFMSVSLNDVFDGIPTNLDVLPANRPEV